MRSYKRILLASRPVGEIDPETTFKAESVPFDLQPGPGQALVRVTWLSLDPAMRGWIRDARSYLPPVQIGEVMRAGGLGTVVKAGEGSSFKQGDVVAGGFGWTEYAVLPDKALERLTVPKGAEALDFLGPLGAIGMTAYFGLYDIGKLKEGETLVVSGAAGAVGSLVCQLGKARGAKVLAIAGGAEKCAWLEKDIGVDKAFDYKDPNWKKEFAKQGYFDVFFDNVGGDILDFLLTRLNKFARIVLCGAISQYNATKPVGPANYINLIGQRGTMQGFIVFDYIPRYAEGRQELAELLASGALKRRYHVVEGLEKAPTALPMLYSGENNGKLVVKVADEAPESKL